MIKSFKEDVYKKLSSVLNITDNGSYEEEFPWVQMRLAGYSKNHYLNTRVETVRFRFDVFSTYAGEAEILDVEETLSAQFEELVKEDARVVGWLLRDMQIIDDNKKGPVSKHGIMNYVFTLAVGDDNE